MLVRRMGRTCATLALLIGAAALPGCGAPTLTQAADDLQATLIAMPGVTDAWVYPDERYGAGFTFTIAVDAPTATPSELMAIAERITDAPVRLTANYTQNVQFWVTPDKPATISRHAHIDAAQLAGDAEQLRAIATDVDGKIDWLRSDDGAVNRLSITGTDTPGAAVLDAVRRRAGSTALTMSVSPATPSPRTPRMSAAFPLSADGQTRIERFLGAIPVDVFGVRIDHDGVRAVQAMVSADPAVAAQDLSTVIEESRADAIGPMWLAWYTPSAVGGVPLFGGLVEIGDCASPAARIRQASLRSGPDQISGIQEHLQSAIGACAAPELAGTGWDSPAPQPILASPPSALSQLRAARDVPAAIPAAVTVRPRPAAAGDPTHGMTLRKPLRLPVPMGSQVAGPRPAAALDFPGPPPPAAAVAGAGGSPHLPTGPHRPLSRTAR
ncbi:hypothetical protein [Mycobacterium sp. shizuoka-1]|uniref:hypothetical protein n=1 Tax=Mycobacterium sp. shizuoka-1 TaxID=2039281 RepID=UPI000C06753B|nr:hypothetical protein [Mycobacterium sp. shizuoka-1]GAY17516.1 hypothetical protein MSZK_42420 [Mycobacterium sp. shizuoka-1]